MREQFAAASWKEKIDSRQDRTKKSTHRSFDDSLRSKLTTVSSVPHQIYSEFSKINCRHDQLVIFWHTLFATAIASAIVQANRKAQTSHRPKHNKRQFIYIIYCRQSCFCIVCFLFENFPWNLLFSWGFYRTLTENEPPEESPRKKTQCLYGH